MKISSDDILIFWKTFTLMFQFTIYYVLNCSNMDDEMNFC